MVSQANLKTGRARQKLRTRNALVGAAWELLREGRQPTVGEVADKAMISRATAYRYFPGRERLLIEAVLSHESVPADSVLAKAKSDSPAERVAHVQEYLFDSITKNETLYRSLLRSSQEEWMSHKDRLVLRGDQRMELLDAALRSSREKLSNKDLDNLVPALAAMVSVESYVALRDVCHLSKSQSRKVINWAVRKLVEAAFADRGNI